MSARGDHDDSAWMLGAHSMSRRRGLRGAIWNQSSVAALPFHSESTKTPEWAILESSSWIGAALLSSCAEPSWRGATTVPPLLPLAWGLEVLGVERLSRAARCCTEEPRLYVRNVSVCCCITVLISAVERPRSLTGCGVWEPPLFLPRIRSLNPRKRPEDERTSAVGALLCAWKAAIVLCCIIQFVEWNGASVKQPEYG